MKKRILSVALALCLCFSSQSVAHAYEEGISLEKDVLTEKNTEEPTEEITEEPDTSDDELTDGQEDPSQQESDLTEEPDISDDGIPDEEEDFSQQEDDLTEETTEELETSDDEIADEEEDSSLQEDEFSGITTFGLVARDSAEIPTPAEVYNAMIALKSQTKYKEGADWTDDTPYSDQNLYHWNGGTLGGVNISATGCVAFAFILSDAAFGSLPNRMYAAGGFSYSDIKVGDILRVNGDAHTVIVLQVSEAGVVVAEGNNGGKVHWGRTIFKDEVMSTTSHYITRYPAGYVPSDDLTANDIMGEGTFGALTWKLTKAGTLTISGSGAMPDFSGPGEQPWNAYSSQILKVVIGNGVTSIGNSAFYNCGVLSAEIASSVTTIGNSAFYGSSIIAVTIPSSVRNIGDSAFRECQNLSSVTVSGGLETIGQNAFRSCTSLTAIALPASIGEVGAGAFFQCTALTSATFASGSKQVKLGDNLFSGCYYLMSVTLPSSIDRIGEGMFMDCLLLPGVEIPQGAESIGGSAFASSGVSVVVIPDSVTTIGSAAFSACPLTDIYYTGNESQWNSISKMGDTPTAVANATIHYNYIPAVSPAPDDDGNTSDNSGSYPENLSSGNDPGSISGDSVSDYLDFDSGMIVSDLMTSSIIDSGIKAVVETWEPTTPDERKRYDCMGKEAIRYTPSKGNAYQIDIENAMQGPMCFASFEAVLGDYTIGRTYNIYPFSDTIYSTDKEIQFTIEIPSAIYKKGREYKMICVTEGGQPIIYNDLDRDSETITIKTDRFYAYALIYK